MRKVREMMAIKLTNVQKVRRMLDGLIPDAYKTEIKDSFVENGILEAKSGVEILYEEQTEEVDGNIISALTAVDCVPDLNEEEIKASAYYAYRFYLINLKDTLNRDSMGIKTMTLEIKDLHKRVEAIDSLLMEVNREINSIENAKCIGRVVQFGKY